MSHGLVTAAYIISAVLFILALAGLSKQETAKRGNLSGIIGMIIALIATIFGPQFTAVGFGLIVAAMIIGAIIGIRLALKVEMTGMPELIAMLHSFVGLAAVLVGFCTYINVVSPAAEVPAAEVPSVNTVNMGMQASTSNKSEGFGLCNILADAGMFNKTGCENLINTYVAEFNGVKASANNAVAVVSETEEVEEARKKIVELCEIFLGIFIGAVTFTGSIIAFGKLRGIIKSKALNIPFKHYWNLLAILLSTALFVLFLITDSTIVGTIALLVMTLIAFVFGIHLVMSIGGADMPVVISMLNSYSGWAAAAAGFMLSNDLLIVTGALVGSSGAILSYIMCKAMNRSFISVIAGGFGNA